jgi:hypothetical protein
MAHPHYALVVRNKLRHLLTSYNVHPCLLRPTSRLRYHVLLAIMCY